MDWNAIKHEYITTYIGQRPLAGKHGVEYCTLRRRAEREKWIEQRDEMRRKIDANVTQKTVDAAVTNAEKLEQARGLALDNLLSILQLFPKGGGDKVEHYGTDKNGKPYKNTFSLLNIVTMIEKMAKDVPVDTSNATSENMIQIAELVNHPLPDVSIDDVLAGVDDNGKGGDAT